ncbi:hypothetical protein L9F63_005026 [Diploptera punctata]|uniref:STING ligand-binding domain-containing protein n=1 Tax=Diploptera punctata TaxID=6984 RepID=A0AAD7ZEC4_DIPPU|nr:hypothetical protein L9F63_005026 [Diploptera punctata]
MAVKQCRNACDQLVYDDDRLEDRVELPRRLKNDEARYYDSHHHFEKVKYLSNNPSKTKSRNAVISRPKDKISGSANRQGQYKITQKVNHMKDDFDIRINEEEQDMLTYLEKKLKTVSDEYNSFMNELVILNENKGAIRLQLKRVNEEIEALNKCKIKFISTLHKIEERENSLQYEINELSNCMDEINGEIKQFYKECVGHVENSNEILCKQHDTRDCVITIDKYDSEDVIDEDACDVHLVENCNDEVKLYKLCLEQAKQKIEMLEAEIACNLESGMTENFHNVTQIHSHDFNFDDKCNLKTDGAECSFSQSGSRPESRCEIFNGSEMNLSNNSLFGQKCSMEDGSENISLENNIEELKKELMDILMEECNLFKKEMFNVIGQEVKENISSAVEEKISTFENVVQQNLSLIKRDRRNSNNFVEETNHAADPILYEEPDFQYLDYGSILAFNYFYGYLKLILPVHAFGPPPKGIKGKIEAYINAQHLTPESFLLPKLLILVPLTLDTPPDPIELSRDEGSAEGKYWIESAVSLQPEVVARAGNTKRPYSVPVYKIKDPDKVEKPKYVAATIALKSLFDVVNMNPEDSFEIRQNLQETILSFCRTLEIFLNESEDCKDLCEIIRFAHKDSYGNRVNIARLILNRKDKLTTETNKCERRHMV